VEDFCLFGLKTPLSWREVSYSEYELVNARRTDTEAEAMAYAELERLLGDIAPDRVILKKTITHAVTKNGYMLKCTVVSIEDIAKVSEFEVDLSYRGE
jgi:hypothetical protein